MKKLENILYNESDNPSRVKRELEKIFDRVEIEYRFPHEPLFQFNMECFNEYGELVRTIRYGYSNNRKRWFFEDITPDYVASDMVNESYEK